MFIRRRRVEAIRSTSVSPAKQCRTGQLAPARQPRRPACARPRRRQSGRPPELWFAGNCRRTVAPTARLNRTPLRPRLASTPPHKDAGPPGVCPVAAKSCSERAKPDVLAPHAVSKALLFCPLAHAGVERPVAKGGIQEVLQEAPVFDATGAIPPACRRFANFRPHFLAVQACFSAVIQPAPTFSSLITSLALQKPAWRIMPSNSPAA